MNRRVMITGIGVVAPQALGVKPYWSLLTEGRTATQRITFFDPRPYRSQVAAECDFDPAREGLSPQQIRRTDRVTQFAVVSAREALADSGLGATVPTPERTAVVVGSAVGATTSLENEYVAVSNGGSRWHVDQSYAVPFLFHHLVPSSLSAEVAGDVGAEGPVAVVSTGCTSGLDSVGHAAQLIREGSADIVVGGASDAPISPITMACFDAIKATTPRTDDPEGASRPFDRTRDGFVLGEGAAMFVLEEREHARARGAHCYAEVTGYATRSNAFHMTGLRPDGVEMAEAVRVALDQARMNPTEVDYVNAHGSGTQQNDRHETAAFKLALGEHAYRVPVSGIKSMIGHSLGAVGSLEIAACALALEHSVVPPTANLHEPDPACDLDYVPVHARAADLRTALTVGSGFGGFQSAMVLSRPEFRAAGEAG